MKKLTKEQLTNRKRKLHILKNVLFYVSLGFNVLILSIAIVGCATKSDSSEDQASNTQLRQERNYAFDSDLEYYNSAFGYNISSASGLYKPSEIRFSGINDFEVSLGSTYSIVVRTSNDTVIALDEVWDIDYEINNPIQVGDYFSFVTPNFTYQYTVNWNSTNGLFWYKTQDVAPENYRYNYLYLPVDEGYDAYGFQQFRSLMLSLFVQVPYTEYILNYEWSPLAYVPQATDNAYFSRIDLHNSLTFTNNSIYGNSYYILHDTLFSINGKIYTDLLVHCNIIDNGHYFVYNKDYNNPHETIPDYGTYLPDYVYAYNNSSERSLVIYDIPKQETNPNEFHVYEFEAGFRNSQLTRIRLFDRHLGLVSVAGYTNGNALLVNGATYSNSLTNGEMGNVFSLFTDSFKGLSGLFGISLAPGITIGMLLFLPLVGIIVFAIIKVLKK